MSGQPNVGGEGSETEGCRPRSLRGKSGIPSRRALVGNDLGGFLVPFRDTVLLGHGSCLFGVQLDKTTESKHQVGLFRALSVPVHRVCTPMALQPQVPPNFTSKDTAILPPLNEHHGRKCGFSGFRGHQAPWGAGMKCKSWASGHRNSDARSNSPGRALPPQSHGVIVTSSRPHRECCQGAQRATKADGWIQPVATCLT